MAVCDDVPASLQNCVITEVHLGRIISRGKYSSVLEAKWEGSPVAVKQIHATFKGVNAQGVEAWRRKYFTECDRIIRIRHPNIVLMFGITHHTEAILPSLVMERLYCSLKDLLEQNSAIHLDTKISILHQIGLGLRHLHTRAPPIIHCHLSSKKILISRSMEVKITCLRLTQLPDPIKKSPVNTISGILDFMAPEMFTDGSNIKSGKELDVFSFGCVMLHTFSQQWPTPSQHVITDPVKHTLIARSEIERRAQYLDKVDKVVEDVMVPLIVSCVENLPFDRPTIMEVCDQLETLVVNREQSIPDNLLQAQLMLQEAHKQLHHRDVEIEALRSATTRLQVTTLFRQVD